MSEPRYTPTQALAVIAGTQAPGPLNEGFSADGHKDCVELAWRVLGESGKLSHDKLGEIEAQIDTYAVENHYEPSDLIRILGWLKEIVAELRKG